MKMLTNLKTDSGRFAAVVNDADSKFDLELSIYDYIDADAWLFGGVSASMVNDVLGAAGDVNSILVKINSPGGDVFDGIAIYNLLKDHPAKVTVRIDGIAASIASIIAMAGDEILMGTGSQMMIHEPAFCLLRGNAEELREYADYLDHLERGLVDIYVERTGIDRNEISDMIAATTWMGADDAIAAGFADGKSSDTIPAGESARAQAFRTAAEQTNDVATVAASCARHIDGEKINRPAGAGDTQMFGKSKKPKAEVLAEPATPPEGGDDVQDKPVDTLVTLQALNAVAGSLAVPLMLAGVTEVEKAQAIVDHVEAEVAAQLADSEAVTAELATVKKTLAETQAQLVVALESDSTGPVENDGEEEVDMKTAVDAIRADKSLSRTAQLDASDKLMAGKAGA